MANFIKRAIDRLAARKKRTKRPLSRCYISILGIKVPVRIRELEEGVDAKITQALNAVCDIRDVPKARGRLRRLQLADLKLLKIFDAICAKHDIPYYLCFGTLLGAIRHKGYIPWDDDLDTAVPEACREKVQAVLEKELEGTNLMLWGVNETRWDATLRISHRNFHSLNLDVFYEYSLDIEADQRETARAAWEKAHQKYVRDYKKMKRSGEDSRKIREFRESTDAHYRQLLPAMVDFRDPRAKFMTAPLHWPHFRLVPSSAMWPLKRVEFEGCMLNVPNNPDEYLKEHYGDYLSFPPNLNHHQSAFLDFKESDLEQVEGELDEIYRRLTGAQ